VVKRARENYFYVRYYTEHPVEDILYKIDMMCIQCVSQYLTFILPL